MEQNKIIDNIYKKLLKNNFSHDEIREFISLKNNFKSFENYLCYLLIISQSKYDDIKFKMANACSSYLVTINERYNIKPLTISNLKVGDILSNQEIYILGAKGYDGNHQFYFDAEDNLYICLDKINNYSYKDNVIVIKFIEKSDGFLKSKLNQKILNFNFNKIIVFKKHQNNNQFLGFYNFLGFSHFYIKGEQFFGFKVINENHVDSEHDIVEFNNIMNRKSEESLKILKNDLIQITNNYKTESFNYYNIINLSQNHTILLLNVIQYALINKNKEIINEIKRRYAKMLDFGLSIFNLIPGHSFINEYFLIILSNTLDLLYGTQINADYMNNIFICTNKSSMEIDYLDNTIDMRFIKSYKGHYFDLDINKKIFNTTKQNTGIYIFQKTESNNYLFLGFYKVSKITVDKDRKNKSTPIFKLKKMSDLELAKHINYCFNSFVDNSYQNAFYEIVQKSEKARVWTKNVDYIQVKEIDTKLDSLNSNLVKYNWLIKKCLSTYNTNEFNRYYKIYIEFDHRIIDWVLKALSLNFLYFIENKLIEPWTIAYEMTKRNWGNKELFNISYIDHYGSKKSKYDFLKSLILGNNK